MIRVRFTIGLAFLNLTFGQNSCTFHIFILVRTVTTNFCFAIFISLWSNYLITEVVFRTILKVYVQLVFWCRKVYIWKFTAFLCWALLLLRFWFQFFWWAFLNIWTNLDHFGFTKLCFLVLVFLFLNGVITSILFLHCCLIKLLHFV